MNDVTRVLNAIEQGDPTAADELLPLVYRELRELAERRLAHERPGQTLQATALVHEAYIRLVGPDADTAPDWDGRGHFFAAAAEAMRRILIDRARSRKTIKHGGDLQRVTLNPETLTLDEVSADVVALDEALARLQEIDPQKADLVKLRFFAGLSLRQAGAVLGWPSTTADRHWSFARAWLYDALSSGD